MKKLYFFPLLLLVVASQAQFGSPITPNLSGFALTSFSSVQPTLDMIYWDSVMKIYLGSARSVSQSSENFIYHWTGGTALAGATGRSSNTGESAGTLTDSSIYQLFQTRLTIKDGQVTVPGQSIASLFAAQGIVREQHNAGTVIYSQAGLGAYASVSSGDQNGVATLALLANPSPKPFSPNGVIGIYQSATNSFGLTTLDSVNAVMGWSQACGKSIVLNASMIQTGASVESQGYIMTRSAFVALDGSVELSKIIAGAGTLGYFGSKTTETTSVEVKNWHGGLIGSAGYRLSADGSFASLAVYPDNQSLYTINAGSLVLQSTTAQGILINMKQRGSEMPLVRFAVDDQVVGSIGPDGITTVNMSDENMRSIPNPRPGAMVFNTTMKTMYFYNGRRWNAIKTDDTETELKEGTNKVVSGWQGD